MNRRVTYQALAAALVLSCLATATSAHPFHVSVTEAEWNAESKRLEVAIRLSAEDLEAALNAHAEKKVTLDETESADDSILAYLKASFIVRRTEKDDPLDMEWIGKEVTTKAIWLYFELEAPDGVEGCELTNRVLFDAEESQINTVNLTAQGLKASLRCDRKHPSATIQFEQSEPTEKPEP